VIDRPNTHIIIHQFTDT